MLAARLPREVVDGNALAASAAGEPVGGEEDGEGYESD